MKVTYEFDTASENFDSVEYNVVMNATKLSSILWGMDLAIRGWCNHPKDYVALTPDTLRDKWVELFREHSISLEDLVE
jgi:hypothetical protein